MGKKILFLFCLVFLFACSKKKEVENIPLFSETEINPGEKAIVTGKIRGFELYPHVKLLELKLIDFKGIETVLTSPFSEDGMFYFEFFPYTTREISFYPIEDRIVISPGDSLYIEKDLNDIGKSAFSGTSGELNKAISEFRSQYLGRYNTPHQQSLAEFRAETDKEFKANQEKLLDFQNKNKTSEIFNQWAEKQISYNYYKALFDFPFQHFLATKEQLTGEEKEKYYEFVKEFEEKVDNSLLMADFFEVINGYGKFIMNRDYSVTFDKNRKVPDPVETLTKFKSASKNNYLSQFIVSDYIGEVFLLANKTDWIEENRDFLNKTITDPFLRYTLNNKYNSVKSYNENPRIYSDVVLGNNGIELKGSGALITDSANVLKHIVSSNPGKVLYIDLWAPWCGPCVDLLPYARDLNKYFEGKPVTFVYICIGSSEEKWRKTIEEYQLSGIHHLCSPEEQSDVMKRLKTNGIPYYALFNKDGVMVDFGSHLRPNVPETKLAIEKLLETK